MESTMEAATTAAAAVDPSEERSSSTSTFRFADHYTLQHKLSEGSFGTVHVAHHAGTNQDFAVKMIKRERLSDRDKELVYREIETLKACRGVDHIVGLVDYYVEPNCIYVVQVYAEGGDVFERLATRSTYNEKLARDLAVNLLGAISELHERKIVHRDLKPENLLLRSMLDDSDILVADFGFARRVPDEGGLSTRCGTPAFVAPEVLVPDCRYDERVDMWSVGCLLYMLIGGYPPFQAPNHRALFRKIQGADFCFHDKYWKNVSVSAKQLIASLLTVDPANRATAKMALEMSNWLRIQPQQLEMSDLSASLDEMKKFNAKSSLKGAIHTVMWSVRSKFKMSDYSGLAKKRKEWDETDEAAAGTDSSGELKTEIRPTLAFYDVYELKDKIHDGKATNIWRCEHKVKKEIFAVKVVDRKESAALASQGNGGTKSVSETICHEVAVLNWLQHDHKHDHILSIIDFFDEEDYYYLVMEDMEGGDVFDRILQKQRYTENDARELAQFLLEAVNYLHKKGIAHRDLKPQNLLLKSKDDDALIKIADFGFACRVHTPMSLTKRCGTPTYVAPEILKNIPYDQSSDMWSVGVILYVLLCGYPPFAHENQSTLFEKIRIGEYNFYGDAWRDVSEDAKNLIRHLLVVDPASRWTAEQALHSEWLHEDCGSLEKIDLTKNTETMRQDRRRQLKGVAKAIMWMQALGDSKQGGLKSVETLLSRPEAMQGLQLQDPDKSSRNLFPDVDPDKTQKTSNKKT